MQDVTTIPAEPARLGAVSATSVAALDALSHASVGLLAHEPHFILCYDACGSIDRFFVALRDT
jgi:hypothetical protein